MNRNEHHVPVLVGYLHDFMDPALVVPHPHKPAEYAHSVVYMHHIVTYIERIEVIYSQLLALFDRAAYADSLEAVEYLVV